MVSPDSNRVSRVRLYSGANLGSSFFRIRDYHPVSCFFPEASARIPYSFGRSYNPSVRKHWFGLFPLRSPLLWESLLISFPLPTKMFQFGRYRLLILCIQIRIVRYYSHWVAPFGDLRVNAFFQLTEAFRRYTRPSSPVDAKASTSSPY